MIDILRKNVEKEIEILREMSIFLKRLEFANPVERTLFLEGLEALRGRMRESNDRTLEILREVGPIAVKKKEVEPKASPPKKKVVKINAKEKIDREKFLKELSITSADLKRIKKKREEKRTDTTEFREARGYLKIANKMFFKTSDKLIKKGYFSSLPDELRKSNLNILVETYVATLLFSTLIAFFVSILVLVSLLFLKIGAVLQIIWIPLVVPIGVFLALYYYPTAEKKNISGRINEELPFAVMHMSSISGSGIEPTQIFKIVALSKEYPLLRKEIRKVLNQVNIYGYDLVTALNNVSKSTSNPSLSELFSGLSTTITSGGELSEFFEKRADTLLNNYRLAKEKSIKIAETSMDIYISVVIAAPMILMLMLIMISVSGIQIGFTPQELTIITIGGVALINVAFLGYLQTRRSSLY